MFTVNQLAERWQLTPEHVRRLIRAGELTPTLRFGRSYRFSEVSVEAYERAHNLNQPTRRGRAA
jgi:excisionase family DNA binding protein